MANDGLGCIEGNWIDETDWCRCPYPGCCWCHDKAKPDCREEFVEHLMEWHGWELPDDMLARFTTPIEG